MGDPSPRTLQEARGSHVITEARAIQLFDCLQDGQPLLLRSPTSGEVFCVTRVANDYHLPAYTVSQNGQPVQGYRGIILDRQRVIDWLQYLEEMKEHDDEFPFALHRRHNLSHRLCEQG